MKSRWNAALALVLVVGLAVLPGCQAPTAYEKAGYDGLVAQGAAPIEEYNPALAGCLNILPGIGDAYMGEWGPFVANFLLWPFSVVWGVPEAAITAGNKNVKATYYHYTLGPGKGQYKIDQGTDAPAPNPYQ